MALLNRAYAAVSAAPGTGSFTLGAAEPGYQTWAAAGAVNGTAYSYTATEGTSWESGLGTYNDGVLTRTTVDDGSSGAGVKVNFGAQAKVFCTPLKRDIPNQNETEQYAIAVAIALGA